MVLLEVVEAVVWGDRPYRAISCIVHEKPRFQHQSARCPAWSLLVLSLLVSSLLQRFRSFEREILDTIDLGTYRGDDYSIQLLTRGPASDSVSSRKLPVDTAGSFGNKRTKRWRQLRNHYHLLIAHPDETDEKRGQNHRSLTKSATPQVDNTVECQSVKCQPSTLSILRYVTAWIMFVSLGLLRGCESCLRSSDTHVARRPNPA